MDTSPITYQDSTSDKIEGLISRIDQALSGVDADQKEKAKIRRIKKVWPSQINNYEKTNREWGGRTSMSKTDTGTYPEHMSEFKNLHGNFPKESICDAGYGSEENYTFAAENDSTPYIKYNYFHKEQSKKRRNDPFLSNNFYYNQQKDCYYCPMGQPMRRISQTQNKSTNGFIQTYTLYQAVRCTDCPLRCRCHKAKGNRIILVSHNLNRLRDRARALLTSE